MTHDDILIRQNTVTCILTTDHPLRKNCAFIC